MERRLNLFLENRGGRMRCGWLVLALLLLFLGGVGASAQTSVRVELRLDSVEQAPVYKGGAEQFVSFLQKEILYPADAREYGVAGQVTATFTIDASGKLQEPKAKASQLRIRKQHTEVDGYTGATQKKESERWWSRVRKETGAQMEDEVVRVLYLTRKWKPGQQQGEKIPVKATVNVFFEYQENKEK